MEFDKQPGYINYSHVKYEYDYSKSTRTRVWVRVQSTVTPSLPSNTLKPDHLIHNLAIKVTLGAESQCPEYHRYYISSIIIVIWDCPRMTLIPGWLDYQGGGTLTDTHLRNNKSFVYSDTIWWIVSHLISSGRRKPSSSLPSSHG